MPHGRKQSSMLDGYNHNKSWLAGINHVKMHEKNKFIYILNTHTGTQNDNRVNPIELINSLSVCVNIAR